MSENIGKTLRDFSAAGPCLPQGEITRETPTAIESRDRYTNEPRRIMKRGQRWQLHLLHIEPCPSCTDHTKTQYPNGYEA
jgi:hypothetical protein